ncbi:MAG: hypothetical protein KDA24_01895 [Deltaproteobacteria bacterium]|nr:hypothetical protein [Deltaproteobacteria bacterium]
MKGRNTIAPVVLPHTDCEPGCPLCPPSTGPDARRHAAPSPRPEAVHQAVERALLKSGGTPVEIAFYGGDLWALPRAPRTALLDAAETEVRRRRACGIRLSLGPKSVLRAPLGEFRARGVVAVEVHVLTVHPESLRALGITRPARAGLDALGRLHRARLRAIAVLTPGLPMSSHRSAMTTVDAVLRARPDGVRILPALALGGTRLGAHHRRGRWIPMEVREAITTCREMVRALRSAGVPVLRVGLQPDQDLWEAPPVLSGPFDPSLRTRVETELLRGAASAALTSAWSFGTRAVTFVVHPREESWLRGHENSTLRGFQERFRLDTIRVLALSEQPRGRIRAIAGLVERDEVPPLRGARKAS